VAKLDKSLYTKQEIREIRKQKRENKLAKLARKFLKSDPELKKNNILVLKHGTKYGPEYVNKMFKMVTNNLTLPFNFYCITENAVGLDREIKIIDLPRGMDKVAGWWYKPYIFSKDLPIDGTILYVDLDMVVCDNMDKLFTFYPKQYCVLRDFTRSMRPGWEKYNSSLIRFEKGSLDHLWVKFKRDSHTIMGQNFGDQDYLWNETQGQATYWPDDWIRSWKWEVRNDRAYAPGGHRGNRKLATIEQDAHAPPECCIVAFHGDPNPHNCEDPFIVDRWHKI
tara:strand:- start:261 stop:1100 length:840 start_codon:yes stop_codon:yes gene_type:complete